MDPDSNCVTAILPPAPKHGIEEKDGANESPPPRPKWTFTGTASKKFNTSYLFGDNGVIRCKPAPMTREQEREQVLIELITDVFIDPLKLELSNAMARIAVLEDAIARILKDAKKA
jgi:hypothetical protein